MGYVSYQGVHNFEADSSLAFSYLVKCNVPCATFTGDGPWVKFQQDAYDASRSIPWTEDRLR